MLQDAQCVDCQKQAPRTTTEQTLLSKLGWRIARRVLSDGDHMMELRCPECWERYKISRPPPSPRKR